MATIKIKFKDTITMPSSATTFNITFTTPENSDEYNKMIVNYNNEGGINYYYKNDKNEEIKVRDLNGYIEWVQNDMDRLVSFQNSIIKKFFLKRKMHKAFFLLY